MNQHNDLVGERAISMLVQMINNGERGLAAGQYSSLIGSSWVDGQTVRRIQPTRP